MNLEQIIRAVENKETVCWSNHSYTVVNGGKAGYLIQHSGGHCIGLTWADNKTLNGKEEQFFIKSY